MTNDFERLQRDREMEYEEKNWKPLNRREECLGFWEIVLESTYIIISLIISIGSLMGLWYTLDFVESFWRIKP